MAYLFKEQFYKFRSGRTFFLANIDTQTNKAETKATQEQRL